jgi:cyclic beta-1,2-glucan synthetase
VRRGSSEYRIVVDNPEGVNRGVRRVELDGVQQPDGIVPVGDDGALHQVRVVMGKASP